MKRILIIRLSAMGDVAISVPMINALKQAYPNLKISILTRSGFAPLFSHLTDCEVIKADFKNQHKGLKGLWKLFLSLKKQKFDAVADLHSVLRTHFLTTLFRLTGTKVATINKGRTEKKQLTRTKQKRFVALKPTYLRYADVFAKLSFPIDTQNNHCCPTPIASNEVKKLIDTNKIRIGIAPFAAHIGKQFPWENLKKVIKQLSDSQQYSIYLFGGGDKQKEQLQEAVTSSDVVNCVGLLGFQKELELIGNLHLMLSMDSGNAHLSALYGVPTLTIWGVTHPFAGFYPYNQPEENALLADRNQFPEIPTSVYGNRFPAGYEKCFDTISTTQIIQKIEEILQKYLHTNKNNNNS